jgi:hypothetical protein
MCAKRGVASYFHLTPAQICVDLHIAWELFGLAVLGFSAGAIEC